MKFGDILRGLLETHELSQKRLASDLHISSSAIGNYVRNNREPDYQTLIRIADYFKVTTDYLLDHHAAACADYRDGLILQIFHGLNEEQKELYIEQGKVFLHSNSRIKENASAS